MSRRNPVFLEATSLVVSPLQGVSLTDLQELVSDNPYLKGYLQGYLAEQKLTRALLSNPYVKGVSKIPDHLPQSGDLQVTYRDLTLTLECKSVTYKGGEDDLLHGGWGATVLNKRSSTRASAAGLPRESTHIRAGSFDGLAISTFSATGTWDFLFLQDRHIPRSKSDPAYLRTSFKINSLNTPRLYRDLGAFLEDLYALKSAYGNLEPAACNCTDQPLPG